jgi:hypothetical protein
MCRSRSKSGVETDNSEGDGCGGMAGRGEKVKTLGEL